MQKKWFSFIEIVIVITIIALLAVIGVSLNSQYQEKTMNAKISSDIDTLKWSLSLYKTDTSSLPLPLGNINFYWKNAEYMHSQSWAYWVYWSIRENILPKKYINLLPVDPRTNQYYAYGKTLLSGEFEIAWVVSKDGRYESIVVWDYTWKDWPQDLIREYNGTNFVFNGSQEIFPYNPEKKAMNAKIISNSWAVTVNGQVLNDINIPSTILVSWDSVAVGTWSNIQIGFSDGSISTLWDMSTNSEMVLAYLDYKNNTFFTKIVIALKIGTLWSQATKLDTQSEFQIYTSDTTASVRGTIFWMSKNALWSSKITVNTWKVAIAKVQTSPSNQSFENLVSSISQGQSIQTIPLELPWITSTWYEWTTAVSYIEVQEWQSSLSVESRPDWTTTSLGITQPIEDKSFSNGISLEVTERNEYEVFIKRNPHFKWTDKIIKNNGNFQSGSLVWDDPNSIHIYFWPWWVTWAQALSTYWVKICRTESLCTKTLVIPTRLQKTPESVENVCNGIKIGERCVRNELSASGYTLVGVADYTRKDSTLYTYNGWKISGSYSWNALSSDWYRPMLTSWTGIVYNLSKLINEKDFIAELMVDGVGFKTATGQHILQQNHSSYIKYDWIAKKFYFLGSALSNFLTANISDTGTYLIHINIFQNYTVLKILSKDRQEIYSWMQSTGSGFSILDNVVIGKRNTWYSPWQWYIKWIKLYKKTPRQEPKRIDATNNIDLRREE